MILQCTILCRSGDLERPIGVRKNRFQNMRNFRGVVEQQNLPVRSKVVLYFEASYEIKLDASCHSRLERPGSWRSCRKPVPLVSKVEIAAQVQYHPGTRVVVGENLIRYQHSPAIRQTRGPPASTNACP